jgi:uncharacterized phage-like protein YoqJ
MKIGITGHQKLDNPAWWYWVEQELNNRISEFLVESSNNLTGVSSLAVGADQIFAELILKVDGKLHAVAPFSGYEKTFDAKGLSKYKNFIERASEVEILPAKSTDQESYFAAGKRVVELSDVIIAVWNGKKAAGLGGTGDAVEYARQNNKKVIHLNPNSKEIKII